MPFTVHGNTEWAEINQGLSLRDYFAAMAMQGLCVNLNPEMTGHQQTTRSLAANAYVLADEMISVREKGKDENA